MLYESFHGEIQNGNHVDKILREYFKDYNYHGVFIDIGAYEPINISNSYHFEKNNWDVYCFEANTLLIPELKTLRKNVYNYAIYDENKHDISFNVVHGSWGGGSQMAGISAIELDKNYMDEYSHGIKNIFQISVPQKTLNNVIETEIPTIKEIDIISIDVEGGELKVLKGIDLLKYKPKIMVIENVYKSPDINNYLNNFGYIMDKRIEYNEYYRLIEFEPK